MDEFEDKLRRRIRGWLSGSGPPRWASEGERPTDPLALERMLQVLEGVEAARLPDGGWRLAWTGLGGEPTPEPDVERAVRSFDAARVPGAHPDVAPLAAAQPSDLLFLDLETLGLGNSAVFLIGCLTLGEGGACVQQLLARDYSEEASIIREFARLLRGRRVLVSFNGKSFDWPVLTGRAGMWHVALPGPDELAHLDVLYECRRRWGGRLPDCRLVTIESRICGRERRGDVQGERIPQVYHDFVATGDARLIEPVLRHNALDLVTLAEVLGRLLG